MYVTIKFKQHTMHWKVAYLSYATINVECEQWCTKCNNALREHWELSSNYWKCSSYTLTHTHTMAFLYERCWFSDTETTGFRYISILHWPFPKPLQWPSLLLSAVQSTFLLKSRSIFLYLVHFLYCYNNVRYFQSWKFPNDAFAVVMHCTKHKRTETG